MPWERFVLGEDFNVMIQTDLFNLIFISDLNHYCNEGGHLKLDVAPLD